MNISNFYTNNDLKGYQYTRFAISEIPQEIIDKYNLKRIVHEDGYCYTEIRKALYGLQEPAYIANVKLKRILGLEGYVPSKFTTGLSTHKTREIAFSLVVDNFGVRYKKKEDVEHLLKTIKVRYPVKEKWEPTLYLGVTLEFDYEERTCKMSMSGYVKHALINSIMHSVKQHIHYLHSMHLYIDKRCKRQRSIKRIQ